MKRRVCSAVILMAMFFSLSVNVGAVNDNGILPQYTGVAKCSPTLSFSGKAATCAVVIKAKESTAKITATMTLYKVGSDGTLNWVADWKSLTGTGNLTVSKKKTVIYVGNYRLRVNGTVTDKSGSYPISAYCESYCF